MKIKEPLISKEQFVKTLKFMQGNDATFDKLCAVMEELAPSFRVDFVPNLEYNTIIIQLLELLTQSTNIIDYFVYELEYGTVSEDKTVTSRSGKKFELKSPEDLYDAIVDDLSACRLRGNK